MCRYYSNLISLHYKGLGNRRPLIFNTKEIQIQMDWKTISGGRTSNLLHPQLFNLKGGPLRMITQNASASVYEVPFPTKSCTKPKAGGYGHKTSLGKAWGGWWVVSNEWHTTSWFILLHNWRNKNEKKKLTTPYVSPYQSKSISPRYIQALPLGLKRKITVLITEEGKTLPLLLQCNTASYEPERRAFQTKPSPARAYKPQTTYPSLTLSPATGNLVNSLPSPTIKKFHLSPLLGFTPTRGTLFPAEISNLSNFPPHPPFN